MKAFKILVGVIIFFIIAALIGYGFEWLFIKVLPGNIASTLTAAHTFGIRALSISTSISGFLGMVCSYGICTYTIKL